MVAEKTLPLIVAILAQMLHETEFANQWAAEELDFETVEDVIEEVCGDSYQRFTTSSTEGTPGSRLVSARALERVRTPLVTLARV